MTRVALDLLGGDHAPESVVDGALLVTDPEVELVLVGPVELAERLLADRGATGRFRLVAASQVVEMDEDPARAVRAKRDATVRVAARLVRDGSADAVVSVGSTGAALAAAVFTLGRLRGDLRRPDEHDREAGLLVERQQGAVDHRLGRAVAAHQVEGDADHGVPEGRCGVRQTARTVRLS